MPTKNIKHSFKKIDIAPVSPQAIIPSLIYTTVGLHSDNTPSYIWAWF